MGQATSDGVGLKIGGRPHALARLAENPEDGVAWRTLVGLGDAVARSAAIDHLRQDAQKPTSDGKTLGIKDALDALEQGRITGDELVQPLYDDLIHAYQNAKIQLAEYVGAHAPSTATKQGAEAQPKSAASITVAAPEQALGMRFDTVIFGGCVNGLIPVRGYFDPTALAGVARTREWTRATRLFSTIKDCACTQFIATAFTTCNLQAAEMMDLHIESIKLRRGVRTAKVQPSELLSEDSLA